MNKEEYRKYLLSIDKSLKNKYGQYSDEYDFYRWKLSEWFKVCSDRIKKGEI